MVQKDTRGKWNKINNQGLSLVELLVSIAVLGILEIGRAHV